MKEDPESRTKRTTPLLFIQWLASQFDVISCRDLVSHAESRNQQ